MFRREKEETGREEMKLQRKIDDLEIKVEARSENKCQF